MFFTVAENWQIDIRQSLVIWNEITDIDKEMITVCADFINGPV